MTNLILNKEAILKRINGIQEEIKQMEKAGDVDFSEYEKATDTKSPNIICTELLRVCLMSALIFFQGSRAERLTSIGKLRRILANST